MLLVRIKSISSVVVDILKTLVRRENINTTPNNKQTNSIPVLITDSGVEEGEDEDNIDINTINDIIDAIKAAILNERKDSID